MKELVENLCKYPSGYLATIDHDGEPHVRAFGFLEEKGGHLYFATAKNKDVYKQLIENPKVEFAVSSPDFTLNMRIHGIARFDDSIETKRHIIEKFPSIKAIYQSWDNPVLTAIYIIPSQVEYWNFSGTKSIFKYSIA